VLARVRVGDLAGRGEPWEGTVWLRRHLDGFALTGMPLRADDPSAPAPTLHEEIAP
jgi:hypothetical protein